MDWLLNTIYYVVPFLILLGILVFVHEFGHFLVARMVGVQVSAFSIGFGKELWGRRDKKGTYWKISAIPLGGYCQFLGDADASSSTADGTVQELTEEEKKKAFPFQNPFKKLAIVIAGPGFNYLFAILLYAGLFFAFGKITIPPIVGEVIPEGAAAQAGIVAGDRIISINGEQINSFADISREVAMAADHEVKLEVKRGDEVLNFNFSLTELSVDDEDGAAGKQFMLGVKSVSAVEISHEKVSLPQAVVMGANEVWDVTVTTLRGVGQMITGKRGSEDVGGVIRIAEMTGDISKTHSFVEFIVFMALLSVNLGLINLFPIPVLDGGHVVFFLIEIITGRELNEKVKEYLFKAGLTLLLALMLFATWNDIVHLVNRWFN
jgi:regulator of sigma E protease